ncbi:MAG: zinc ribbon domain-containing protein [Nitrospirota bacterium]|jgi:putative FmdB family regulatory protein
MPIYEYRCTGCGSEHEFIQKFSDPPREECPNCGGKLEKLISNTSFVLKGSGWYVTDYASGERKAKMEAEKSGSAPSGDSGSGKSGKAAESAESAKSEGTPGSGTSDKAQKKPGSGGNEKSAA